ncbi:MAG: hypothetical protein ACH350_07500 [Parachlamydiaceae bacterium]
MFVEYIKNAEMYIDAYAVKGCKGDEKKFVRASRMYCVLVPTSFIAHAADTVIGLGAAILAIGTLGVLGTQTAEKYCYNSSRDLLAKSYYHILRAINPKEKDPFSHPISDSFPESFFGLFLNIRSIIYKNITPFYDKAKDLSRSSNFLEKHVISRCTYALLAVAYLVTKVVEGIFCIPIAAFSILTAGKYKNLNQLARLTLAAPSIIYHLFCCIMGFINPKG